MKIFKYIIIFITAFALTALAGAQDMALATLDSFTSIQLGGLAIGAGMALKGIAAPLIHRAYEMSSEELKKITDDLQSAAKTMHGLIDDQQEFTKKYGTESAELKAQQSKVNDKIDDLEAEMKKFSEGQKSMEALLKAPGKGSGKSAEPTEEQKAWTGFLAKALSVPEAAKALSSLSEDDGAGIVVPEDVRTQFISRMRDLLYIRQQATIINTTRDSVSFPNFDYNGSAEWTGQGESIGVEDLKKLFGKTRFAPSKLARIFKLPDELITDAAVNVEQLLLDHFATRYGEIQENAFINGDGVDKPLGVLAAGLNTTVATPQAGDAPFDSDDIISLAYDIKGVYRANGSYMMHREGIRHARLLKDANEHYLWQPSVQVGQPATINGFGVTESEYFPENVTGGSTGDPLILFGDWSWYWIVDRLALTVKRLDEFYAATGEIGYRLTMRTDAAPVKKDPFQVLTHA